MIYDISTVLKRSGSGEGKEKEKGERKWEMGGGWDGMVEGGGEGLRYEDGYDYVKSVPTSVRISVRISRTDIGTDFPF